mmetsp:Transcript_18423/g.34773  ORF Transcript_18423/g.34773 Transcript_18423/m.34773 type:complete len:96 (-) Transcript_18423:360-647(-)
MVTILDLLRRLSVNMIMCAEPTSPKPLFVLSRLVEVVLHQILFNMSFYPELRIGVVAFLIHSEGPAKIYPHLETAIEKAGAFIEKKLAEVMKKKE